MIRLRACPIQFGLDEWTEISIEGEDEEDVAALLTSRLSSLDWEVETVEEE